MNRCGPLALVGGDEFRSGNEPQDRVLVEAAREGPAFVLATAAAEQRPDLAVRHAVEWFEALGLEVEELPATSRGLTEDPGIASRARAGRFFYLVGGNPGLIPRILGGTPVWDAMVEAWRGGAALAGSSAGAMALCDRTFLPGSGGWDLAAGLGLVPDAAVVPHFDTFGASWDTGDVDGQLTLLGLDERTAAVWHGGVWLSMGEGTVQVVSSGDGSAFRAGETIEGLPQPRI